MSNLQAAGSRRFGRSRIAAKLTRATGSLACNIAGYTRKTSVRVLLLLLVGAAAHAPALQGEFVWDDQYLAHDNPLIKSPILVLETFRQYLFLDSFSTHYRPVQNISFMLDYFFWNTNTFGFHLTNVLLHVTGGVLLYFLLRQLFASLIFPRASVAVRTRSATRVQWTSLSAFLVSMVWIVHPVHSAAVDYISGRADSLAFVFACAGWLLFMRGRNGAHRGIQIGCYSLAGLLALLALLSREVAVVWLLLFLVHLFFVERHKAIGVGQRVVALCSCLLLIVIYLGLRELPSPRVSASVQDNWSAPVRAALMARALGDYARLLVFPTNLHMERTVFNTAGIGNNSEWRQAIGAEYLSIIGLLFFAVLICGSLKRGRAQTMRIFGAAWFLAGYLPISNLIQLNATVAEHWLYLPSVGFLIFIAGSLLELPRAWQNRVAVCALSTVMALGTASFVRSSDWVSGETFYKRTLASGGTSARVITNLARIYAERHDYPAAERMLRRVMEVAPDYSIAINNLADLLFHNGKMAEAEKLFRHSAEVAAERSRYPRPWIGAVNVAIVRHKARDDEQALATLAKERAAHPNVWDIVSYESEILRQSKGPEAALPLVKEFVRANWWHYGAALALGRLYAEKGDFDRAHNALRHASRLDVHDTQALSLLATMSMQQNHLEDACRIQRRAIARQPDEPRQYILLSNILEKMGREDEARAALAHVSQLREFAHHESTLLN
ncbi:MAG TPA: tetratricopeptide repeat protein [Chthoniobacterales bacterium]|nr:tetratricopeptide repeat protein [Chthoniobacterales bacterium]